jgi:hypothetical protein
LLLLWQKNALIGRLGSTLIFKDPLIILQFIALPNHLTYMSVSTTEVEWKFDICAAFGGPVRKKQLCDS